MSIKIEKDMKIVSALVAEARGERLDSAVSDNINKVVKDQAADLNPMNRHQIAQLVGFAVNEMNQPQANLFEMLGDFKQINHGDKAMFRIPSKGIKAFIQARGATTARSKVTSRQVSLDTEAVSVRPVINIVELQTGQTQMSDLIREASVRMQEQMNKFIYKVLIDAATTWASPFYAAGAGIVEATLKPILQYWMRNGGASIVGDIAVITKLAETTGFTAATKQFADSLILEQNANGFIGTYYGSKVTQLVNPYEDDALTPQLDINKLFILPNGVSPDMRPLKIVKEGSIMSTDAQNIDDLTYEIRLDQAFGAGIVYGDRPYLSIYEDSSI